MGSKRQDRRGFAQGVRAHLVTMTGQTGSRGRAAWRVHALKSGQPPLETGFYAAHRVQPSPGPPQHDRGSFAPACGSTVAPASSSPGASMDGRPERLATCGRPLSQPLHRKVRPKLLQHQTHLHLSKMPEKEFALAEGEGDNNDWRRDFFRREDQHMAEQLRAPTWC